MMLINGFVGEVVDPESVLNEFSYTIALYGEPDLRDPHPHRAAHPPGNDYGRAWVRQWQWQEPPPRSDDRAGARQGEPTPSGWARPAGRCGATRRSSPRPRTPRR
ncbi:hypothetical protein [Blastococcus brunescens]|uniref:Uncharacterized protein n=1 Tax=Blastococcus brunescens TaxID=1564165 RepID=A0ABZ1BA67_9ACTN|nr:hypothetical protein [Blastococcus sp. BMG 8361]WRL66691.1 hypothetical protein U6N30_15645 [Blastococcus sp. BMG 8361]